MGELIKTILERFSNLSKNKQFIILGGMILLIVLLLISGGIGSNNEFKNTNNGIQGNGNSIQKNNGNIQGDVTYNISNSPKAKPFKENFTLKKGGQFVVVDNWKEKWKSYLTIYKNFVDILTPNGYLLLNSPNKKDVEKFYKKENIEVSGYIRTTNGIFYMTKYSYDNRGKDGFPKFIYIIE